MLPLLILLVEFVLLIFLGKIRKKIMDYTRSDELYFWGLFLKKSDSRQKMKQIKKKVLQTYRRSSLKNELLFWLEFTVAKCCFYGSLIWSFYVIAFGNSRTPFWPAIIGFIMAIPPAIALPQQLYDFWKQQPIWHEHPIEKQAFLLPNEQDHKDLVRYHLQSYSALFVMAIIGFLV
ncbi:hypothetical protein [Lactiplantibacillus plantarum]|uniref:hypothetical protein n=2 Tax=Lactiplantibacillus plantarum TaxID=1590 RepID=UPI0035247F9A